MTMMSVFAAYVPESSTNLDLVDFASFPLQGKRRQEALLLDRISLSLVISLSLWTLVAAFLIK